MSKQAQQRVTVKLKDIKICSDSPHLAEWIYKNKHQKWLSRKEMQILATGGVLRLKTLHPPKHTARSLKNKWKKRDKRNEKISNNIC